MNGSIYRITELNPKLTMEIARLLELTGQASRNMSGGELFGSFGSGGEVTGISGGRRIETDCLIRFVAVHEEARHDGIGSALLSRLLSFYADSSEAAWVLAPKGSGAFFTRFGFERVMSDILPPAVRESRDVAGIEIAAAEIMMLELPKKWPIL